ncbi:MAG TPA: outer membrane lipoprotein-sorting protein [Terriglobia bacterium]|nr:outer membrane lipoprotein-sorting protein [Terriglobia bacterium]
MRFHRIRLWGALALVAAMVSTALPAVAAHRSRVGASSLSFKQVLSRMDDAASQLKSVSAQLSYTTVTVLVNDRSTQTGELFFHKGKSLEVMVRFLKPDLKVILFKHNRAEIYNPKTNQVQEYNMERHADMLQQFLLLGFGTPISNLESSYHMKYLGEKQLGDETTEALELTPLEKSVASQLTRVDLWVSEDSWLPVQQEFFEPSGDYLIASYSAMKVNEHLKRSDFEIHPASGATRVKMN